MKTSLRRLPPPILFLLNIFGLIVGLLMTFRLVMLLANLEGERLPEGKSLAWAFWMGFHYDAMAASYFMAFPFILMTLDHFLEFKRKERLYKIVKFYCLFVVLLTVLICVIDIPYFKFFNSRLTTAILAWRDNLLTNLRLAFSNWRTFPILIAAYFIIKYCRRFIDLIWRKSWKTEVETTSARAVSMYILAGAMLVFGIRGSILKKPMTMSDGFQDESALVNQLTLNPVLTYFDSYFNEFQLQLSTDSAAVEQVRRDLRVPKNGFLSPIAREFLPKKGATKKAEKPNVVVILMESMSAPRMGFFGSPKRLTPFLDSICGQGLLFDHHFSWGIHTYNGIFSTLYGLPGQILKHPMAPEADGSQHADQFWGLPSGLREEGYQTAFFVTHDPDFDNIQSFIPANGFDYLFSRKDYPPEQVATAWGVADREMFSFATKKLDAMSAEKMPFFATLLTITNHPPYEFGENSGFVPRSTVDKRDAALEYADWALRQFFDEIKSKSWFSNTVFILLGDHGVNRPGIADVPISYNHVPLLFYQPSKIKAERRADLASQIDVPATTFGLLGLPFQNNGLGLNLFQEKRPFVFFTQDSKICVLDREKMLVIRKSGKESMYDLEDAGPDILAENAFLADSMRRFALPQIQTTKWLMENRLAGRAGLVRKVELKK